MNTMKHLFTTLFLLLSIVSFGFSASKKNSSTGDVIVEVHNTSDYEISAMPIIGGEGFWEIKKFDSQTVKPGEVTFFNFSSKDLIDSVLDWGKSNNQNSNSENTMLYFKVKQTDSDNSAYTNGKLLSYAPGEIIQYFVSNSLGKILMASGKVIPENQKKPNIIYSLKNNSSFDYFIFGTVAENNVYVGYTETKLLCAGEKMDINFDLSKIVTQNPNGVVGYCAKEIHGNHQRAKGNISVVVNNIKNEVVLTDDASNITYKTDYISSKSVGKWENSKWFGWDDSLFTRNVEKNTMIMKCGNDNSNIFNYTNYYGDSVKGFEANVTKKSGNDVGSYGYGFTFCEDLNEGVGYIILITAEGIYSIVEMSPEGWNFLLPNSREISFDLKTGFNVENKIKVQLENKDIYIYFNDVLNYIIPNAKYTSGITRLSASHNGNPEDPTEIEYQYLRFLK